jgi:heat shock protein 5
MDFQVSAQDLGTGRATSVKIDNDKGRWTEEDIQRMVKEEKIFAEEDARHRAQVDAKNKPESYLYHSRSLVNGKQTLVSLTLTSGDC